MTNPDQLSVQLYTLRSALADDFDATLARLAGIGFTQVEPFGLTNFAEQLRSGLAAHGLSAPTTHQALLRGGRDPAAAVLERERVGQLLHRGGVGVALGHLGHHHCLFVVGDHVLGERHVGVVELGGAGVVAAHPRRARRA